MKNILIIDDSALMRRVLCDIINSSGTMKVTEMAKDGIQALEILEKSDFDAIILDINMPRMNGIEFLEELKAKNKHYKVVVASTDTADGAAVTIKALELGAFDFIQKPKNTLDARGDSFKNRFISILQTAVDSKANGELSATPLFREKQKDENATYKKANGRKLVALCCSTGGPKALQHVIPKLPKNLAAPVLLVQHMPAGFTESLASRLDSLSEVHVVEAQEGDTLQNGFVYISAGGRHLRYKDTHLGGMIYYSNENPREGVKPSANYMYESIADCKHYDEIVCVVLTGMGADGTAGIRMLAQHNKIHVIAQNEETCTVYGMPKMIAQTGLVNEVVALDDIAQVIIKNVGVI